MNILTPENLGVSVAYVLGGVYGFKYSVLKYTSYHTVLRLLLNASYTSLGGIIFGLSVNCLVKECGMVGKILAGGSMIHIASVTI